MWRIQPCRRVILHRVSLVCTLMQYPRTPMLLEPQRTVCRVPSGTLVHLSTGPDNSEIRKYASIYLVRLGIVGALLALYAMGIISGINDTFDSCKGALDQDKCLSRERIVIVPGYILVTLIAAFPICNIFGWLAVKNNRHYLRVRVINIIGIVFSALGTMGGALVLLPTVKSVVTWGHTVGQGALVSLVATVAPAVDLVFSIVFVVYASRMKRGIYSPNNTYQP